MAEATMAVNELEQYLGIGRKTAYQLVNSKGFPAFRIGRKVLISRDGLERWMRAQQEMKDQN